MLGRRATGLDAAHRRVLLDGGDALPYDDLIIATGSRPRTLPGIPGARVLRTLDDARVLRAALVPGARLAIVGGGFIGQEAAATARSLGCEVAIVEATPALLGHVLGPRLGAWFASLHREEGVRVELGAGVADAPPGALVLDDGRRIAADVVLVAVGVTPACEWLTGTALEGPGIAVDARGRTVLPRVYAAGDVTRGCGHWEPAARGGAAAARAILGLPAAPGVPESFWSDQYGVRIQLAGSGRGADTVAIDGDMAARDFTAVLRRGHVPVGALLVGRPAELPIWRRRLASAGTTNHERSAA